MNNIEVVKEQYCKVCGVADGLNFTVSDEDWEAIVNPELRNSVLCLKCFDQMASNAKRNYVVTELYFAGINKGIKFVPARQIDALYQKPETTARQDMAHFQATQYQPDDRIIPVPPYGDKIDITANLKAQLAHCTPLIEARERERIYKVLTGKCKLHYPTDRNRSDYMKPQIVIDEKDYLEALKPEFKKGEPNVIE